MSNSEQLSTNQNIDIDIDRFLNEGNDSDEDKQLFICSTCVFIVIIGLELISYYYGIDEYNFSFCFIQ